MTIHPTAVIGDPPEHRDWKPGDPMFAPTIDQSATVNAFVSVDAGLFMPTAIGAGALLMKHVHVGHDVVIGADCELAPGTIIGGHAQLGDRVRCGIGVLVKPFVKVGAGARLGMGAVVTKDVPAGEVWVGNPACEIGALMRLRHGRVLPETELTALEMAGWEHLAQAVLR